MDPARASSSQLRIQPLILEGWGSRFKEKILFDITIVDESGKSSFDLINSQRTKHLPLLILGVYQYDDPSPCKLYRYPENIKREINSKSNSSVSFLYAIYNTVMPNKNPIPPICVFHNNDSDKATKLFVSTFLKATTGNVNAQYDLGVSYYHGTGIKNNFDTAMKWLKIAAINGNNDARFYLNIRHQPEKERKIEPQHSNMTALDIEAPYVEPENTLDRLKRLAESGNNKAQYYLGRHYYYSETEKNIDKAIELWTLSAKQGYVDAQYRLNRHFDQFGKNPHAKKAFYWATLATRQGHQESQYLLASYYNEGLGVTKNYKTAFEIWLPIAENGHAKAQKCIGNCFRYGKGVAKNEWVAQDWDKLAEKTTAKNNTDKVYKMLCKEFNKLEK
jgi:TPR repeat protein